MRIYDPGSGAFSTPLSGILDKFFRISEQGVCSPHVGCGVVGRLVRACSEGIMLQIHDS